MSRVVHRRAECEGAMVPLQNHNSVRCTRSKAQRNTPKRNKRKCDRAKEKTAIIGDRCRRLALSRSLSALWNTQPKCIEIGSTVLGKSGARIHVVHYVDSHSVPRIEQFRATHEMQHRVSRILTKQSDFDSDWLTKSEHTCAHFCTTNQ